MQYTEGTQRLEEPVSKMTVKFCGGDPMEIVPKYSICKEESSEEGERGWGGRDGSVPQGSRAEWLGPELRSTVD